MHNGNSQTSGQRFSAGSGNLGKTTNAPMTGLQIFLNIAGGVAIAATYAWTIMTNGAEISQATTISLPLTAGYTAGVVLLLLGNLTRLPLSTLALIPFAAAFNIVLGQIIGFSPLPLYMDAIATVLVGYLAGPAAGMMTGAVTNLAWGLLLNPSTIPFAAGAALIGLLAGYIGRMGLFARWWSALISGFAVGLVAAMIGAPIAAFVFGGGLGVGTGSVVALMQAAGQSMLGATTIQSLLSDPLDKALVFLVVWAVIKLIPARVLSQFQGS